MKKFICDKSKLTIKYIYPDFNNFILPNLKYVKLIDKSIEINYHLKVLFQLDKLCSVIKELDLSHTCLTDNGMLRIAKNIIKCKNLETLNLEETKMTTYNEKQQVCTIQ